MKNNLLILMLLLLTITTSCKEKEPEVIAIDVLLTVPDDLYDQAIQLNRAVLENNPNNFTLDKNHIPHITLLQCYILDSDLSKVEQSLKELFKSIENTTFWADHLQYEKDKSVSFASIGVEKSEPLIALHKNVIEILEPYIVEDGSQESYVPNPDGSPIDNFTIAYVPKFVSNNSHENFNPHISLGVADTAMLDSLEQHGFRDMKFQAPSLSVYQLGDSGTAQKLLWEAK